MSGEEKQAAGPPIHELNIEQLRALSKQIQESIANMSQSVSQLELASAKYRESRKAVMDLSDSKVGEPLMTPLTTSMYVPATITNTETVTIDLGSGYFVKKSIKKAGEFFQRKINFVEKSAEEIDRQIMNARNNLERVQAMISLRIREHTQQVAQTAST